MDYEEVLRVLDEAGARPDEIEDVSRLINLCEAGVIEPIDLYYYIVGLAREEFIPLTKEHMNRIARALGVAVTV